jgi:hypothetical protein
MPDLVVREYVSHESSSSSTAAGDVELDEFHEDGIASASLRSCSINNNEGWWWKTHLKTQIHRF